MSNVTTGLLSDPVLAVRRAISSLPAMQQPTWRDYDERDDAVLALERSASLVTEAEISELRRELRSVSEGRASLVQAGDCAEPMTDTDSRVVEDKAQALDTLGSMLASTTHGPVVRIGRIAGQFAKPRSHTHEIVDGSLLPTYRGALVNESHPAARAREHEPRRLVRAHAAAEAIGHRLRRRAGARIWTSHEALVLDYELPQIRRTSDGQAMLTSAHTVWIGARTSQPGHAHVGLAASVVNPVACKVSPDTTRDELVAIAATIDPDREPGRLTLIARMGSSIARLPALMAAVEQEGHPVIWLSDPMHANTVTASDGRKTRYLDAIVAELEAFQRAAGHARVTAAGVHLETTIDEVRECLADAGDVRERAESCTTLCDPRLTIGQALEVLSHWHGGADA